MGVNFINSKSLESEMKQIILILKKRFQENDFKVVFHHSLDKEKYLSTHNAKLHFLNKHRLFSNWLKQQSIEFVDVSGSVEGLKDIYNECDLHVGFRVHAHIFMCSKSKPSILINEDGRGKALNDVLFGFNLNAYKRYKRTFLLKDWRL